MARGRSKYHDLFRRFELTDSPQERASCIGKERLTKTQARTAAARMYKRDRSSINAYRCPYCNYWHVGKRQKRRETG